MKRPNWTRRLRHGTGSISAAIANFIERLFGTRIF